MPRGETKHLKKHQFKPGQSGNPKGVPKNPIANILKEVTVQTYRDLIALVLKGNVDHLRKIVEDPNSPALLVGIAKCYVKAVDAGDWETIEKISQRIVGKIPDEINVNSKNLNLNAAIDRKADVDTKVKAVLDALEKAV